MGNMLTGQQLTEEVSIANRAMKAVFHRGVGAARRIRDEAAEAAVKSQFGDEGQIVTRKLFANKASLIYKRNQIANEMYTYHMKLTLPHGDDGSRLLPNAVYFEYVQKMAHFEAQLKTLDEHIVVNYPQLVAEDVAFRKAALIAQGKSTVVTADEYPSKEQIAGYLYAQWHLEPIATANDFRYQVAPEIVERLNGRLQQMEDDLRFEFGRRLAEPMQRFVEKLSVGIGEQGSIFRDSMIENLNELVQLLPKLNVNNDPRITELVEGVKAVIRPYVFAPDVLRQNQAARETARDKMKALLGKLEGYGFAG